MEGHEVLSLRRARARLGGQSAGHEGCGLMRSVPNHDSYKDKG